MSEHEQENPIWTKADAAFRQATAKVVERARQTGTPVVIWEDGQVKEVSPDQIETILKTESRTKNNEN